MQKTSYDLRISDWSEDVCSSDLKISEGSARHRPQRLSQRQFIGDGYHLPPTLREARAAFDQVLARDPGDLDRRLTHRRDPRPAMLRDRQPAEPDQRQVGGNGQRSEEHTSELQSLMRISYAVFCLKKKKKSTNKP